MNRSAYRGRWREMVNRSALTLKLLTSRRHGSLVAAPTFGLPEKIGGVRNWDYRYTWIRDASFTLYGLMRLGYTAEAAAFMHWLEARCAELESDGTLQTLYRLDGRHKLPEESLSHLEGYKQSAPVRIGNHAAHQLQLDIYGELLDSVYLYDKYGQQVSYDLWRNVVRLINWVCKNWQQADEGIWEVRGGRFEFLYSRAMCWVALDREIRLAQKRSLPAPLERWYPMRNEIYHHIFTCFWDATRKTFVQHKGATTLDAASLLMPLMKFIGPTDPRWLDTLRAIENELVSDSLVFRYKIGDEPLDGLAGVEGTFSMCSFWYVECLSRAGALSKAASRHQCWGWRVVGWGQTIGALWSNGPNSGPSLTLAAVVTVLTGTPRPSTNRGSLSPGLPRSVGLGPASLSPPGSPNIGLLRRLPLPVDALLLVVEMETAGPQALKNTGLFPFDKPIIDSLPRAELQAGERPPRTAGPPHVEHAIQQLTILDPLAAPLGSRGRRGQLLFQFLPQVIRNLPRGCHGGNLPAFSVCRQALSDFLVLSSSWT